MNYDFTFRDEITKEYLLKQNSEQTYMEFYLGIPVKKGLFRSPLRKDNSPTCSFYKNKNGELIFKDFNGSFCGNFINVVMEKYNLRYYDAINKIASDFALTDKKIEAKIKKIKENQTPFRARKLSKIQVEVQDFSKEELDWWQSYGITKKILNKYKVFSCKHVFLNGTMTATSSKRWPIYGYYGGTDKNTEYWRCYFPTRKSYRFLTNWPYDKIQGYDQLPKSGKIVIITKSMKDCMVFNSLKIPAIAPNSENLFLNKEQLDDLKSRFKYIIVLYDNDEAGVQNMKKIKMDHPELIYTWLPRDKAKDISDFYQKYGKDETVKLIKTFIKWLRKRKSKNEQEPQQGEKDM